MNCGREFELVTEWICFNLGFEACCKDRGFNCYKGLRIGFFLFLKNILNFLELGLGYCRHVLWCCSMGPLANSCPNFLPSMRLLSHSWVILVHSCWEPSFKDEFDVFLWLCYFNCFYGNWVVCHCLVYAQCTCRVRILSHFHFHGQSKLFVGLVL